MNRLFVIVLIMVLSLAFNLTGQQVDYSGTSVANFLKIGVGARQSAMGDAAISTVDDPTGLFWNVATISQTPSKFSFVASSMDWLVDTRLSYIATVLNFKGVGSFGLDFQYLDYGKIEETTVYDQDGTQRFYSASDMAIGLGFARALTPRFSLGVKMKYIQEKLANVQAGAFGFDIGAVFTTSFFNNNLKLAATLANFGTKMKFSGRDLDVIYVVPGSPSNKQIPASLRTLEWEIPLLFRFGISNYFVKNQTWSLLVAYDILDSRDYAVRHNLGMEIGVKKALYLRAGYKFNYDQVSYTAGFGFDFSSILGYNLKLDYVYLDYGVFQGLNQFTLILNL
ncbi:PorV/PorQ family protein [Caldithrix abyssi]|uniref:Type IX secretion system protein PorV domain-containing protein n=1 Tax=Caldithrix abyssi DSM 13497 TaxID=880073 RepID=H1XRE9_CALAY|nr:PorV/PorQ family protein [Caldithrix abyssi]APF18424.1 hypothetical protein Cabys_1675 [Caldithrix abyssi DSM 13497]EHO42430.1 hypothetical protein Calab_2823 [Caldithrix abyssi DSM 13497]